MDGSGEQIFNAHVKIGVFDSGVGGLTVLKVLAERFPDVSFVYLGDTARLPYGSKSMSTISQYVSQNIEFLKTLNVCAVVIACHSASSAWLQSPSEVGMPIYEVITPACRSAAQASTTKTVALMATRATVSGGAYSTMLSRIDSNIQLIQQHCPLLVPFVEEGLEQDPLTQQIVQRYVSPHLSKNFDTLILGCTHYPRLLNQFKAICGSGVYFIDPAVEVALEIARDIKLGIIRPTLGSQSLEIFCTDLSESFIDVATRCMAPHRLPQIKSVETSSILNINNLKRRKP